MEKSMTNVLIAGAGPTGLTLACTLARAGISFKIIDKRAFSSSIPRAININSTTLEIFSKLKVDEGFWQDGLKLDELTVYWNKKRLFNLNYKYIETIYPYFFHLEQSKIEHYLEKILTKLEIKVNREIILTDLIQHNDCVKASIKYPDGSIKEEEFTHVVGCDGGNSLVRELINIDYQQDHYYAYFILMDALIEHPFSESKLRYYLNEDGYLMLVPLPENAYRIIASFKGSFPGKENVDLTIDHFQKVLNERGLGNIKIIKSIWKTSAGFFQKLASRANAGRIFLAGDALHQFSPVGGTNMNTGIHDAYELGKKVILVARGKRNLDYLNSYHAERIRAAKTIMNATYIATQLVTRTSHLPYEESKYLPVMKNRDFIKSSLPKLFSGMAFKKKLLNKIK